MIREFREFIARGNVLDLAVGIIIGAAFTAIVNSMVADLINPVIGLLTGGIDFSGLFVALDGERYPSLAAAEQAGAAVFAYGRFANAVIEFLIVAFAVFLIVKGANRLKAAAERTAMDEADEEAPAGPTEKEILIQIRDALAGGRRA
jgi:large conductance mechanosensitive channel